MYTISGIADRHHLLVLYCKTIHVNLVLCLMCIMFPCMAIKEFEFEFECSISVDISIMWSVYDSSNIVLFLFKLVFVYLNEQSLEGFILETEFIPYSIFY